MRTTSEERLRIAVDLLTNRLAHSHAALRRAYEELDYREEKIRVLQRVIERLGKDDTQETHHGQDR